MASGTGHNIRWLSAVSVWLFLAMIGVLVSAKVSLLWLLRLFKYEQIHPATWYLIVCILLVLPHLCNLFYIMWNTPFISSARKEELPRAPRLFMGLIGSIMEGMSIAIFAGEICLVLPEPIFLCLPAAVYTIPLIISTCKNLRANSKLKVKPAKTSCATIKQCVGIFFCSFNMWAPSAISVIIYIWSPFNMSLQQCISLPIVLMVLSTVWTPKIQKLTVCSSRHSKRNLVASLSYTVIKICTIPATLVGLMAWRIKDFRANMGDYLITGLSGSGDYRIWLPVVITFMCGIVALLLTDAACKVSLTTPGVRLPALLTPIVTFCVTIILWGDVSTEAIWELSGRDFVTWSASALAICIWLVPFAIPGVDIIKAPTALLRPFAENFYHFSWSQMFLEQSLILNFNHKGIGSSSSGLDTVIQKSESKRVFICTTMFRESKAEMSRYLLSLQKLLSSDKLIDIKVESHIFLDNAMDNDSLNTYACQLLTLLVDTFNVTLSSLVAYRTPYGCQILSHPNKNFPVYVHVKDGSKFKVKKRWSQVMYMNYILKYRCSFDVDKFEQEKNDEDKYPVDSNKNAAVRLIKKTSLSGQFFVQTEPNSPSQPDQIVVTTTEDTFDDTGSEGSSASGSDAYTVSRESNASCHTSEGTDSDDSDLFLFRTYPGRGKNTLSVPGTRGVKKQVLMKNVLGAELNSIHDGMEKHNLVWANRKTLYLPASDEIEQMNVENADTVFTLTGKPVDEPVYILATDADTEFSAKSVSTLVELCERDHSLGAACGRTIPIGRQRPMVWYQKFEYAKDFWLVKASQNIIGSVTCCPGCFSLYRARALADVLNTFQEPSNSAFDALVKDHGEDRWLCTLMMLRGWKLEYIDHCRNSTHCPETFMEFLGQRRRWVLSELSNMVLIFKNLRKLVRSNMAFSSVFILSLLQMFLWVLISPSTTLLVMFVACDAIFGLPLVWSVPISFIVFVAYCVLCCIGSPRIQKIATGAMLCLSVILMITVSVGFVYFMAMSIKEDVRDGYIEFRPYFLIPLLIGGVVYAALIHPGEWLNLIYGLMYAFLFPAMFIILPIYAVANIVDQSWGTRELPKKSEKPNKKNNFNSIEELVDDNGESDVTIIRPKNLQTMAETGSTELKEESLFWEKLQNTVLGTDVNQGKDKETLQRRLFVLRNRCVFAMVLLNTFWFSILTTIYVLIDTDVICYILAGIFSFSLLVQLVGMTSYRLDNALRRYVLRKLCSSQPTWIKARH
ncbi:uncharacterized protein LOC126823428 [Patella vulgata]|uniref:uncharacterized protein LOC126823428 n=1 Tax=Patella vulgata TaxID=6465 RepID=UPI0024A8DDDC|nr:uncharacterized protein LOC126823428 [Patella vulgata]XP_050408225.2 uncharacterized protein LOC126823428 [Patella vulgata]XP_050408226.2 uncharacterized protein LOC126823428 [Patella vulgata]XP_050408227.2 uncharacterized protein LOC126823428 [Patella vulgata]